jgi:hypothetical protein
MISQPYSRSCRTAPIRSGRAGGLAEELGGLLQWPFAGTLLFNDFQAGLNGML